MDDPERGSGISPKIEPIDFRLTLFTRTLFGFLLALIL